MISQTFYQCQILETFVERILENTSKTEPALSVEPKVQAKKSRKNDENKAKQRQKTLDLQKKAAIQVFSLNLYNAHIYSL